MDSKLRRLPQSLRPSRAGCACTGPMIPFKQDSERSAYQFSIKVPDRRLGARLGSTGLRTGADQSSRRTPRPWRTGWMYTYIVGAIMIRPMLHAELSIFQPMYAK